MGPLAGLKIVELAGIGPGPMAAMLLSDMGAMVLRIERTTPSELGIKRPIKFDLLRRGRKEIALDLKRPGAVAAVLELIAKADGLIEGFRPGVTERLGLGPEACLKRNPKLVYGRITGWGQTGPLANAAGHDLNYIALTGALHAIGRKGQPPTPPLTIAGDLAGGAVYLAFGMVCALLEAKSSGRGQVVDAAIVDGTAHLMTNFHGMQAAGLMRPERGTNYSDSGAFFYEVYECKDGHWISVAPIEHKFYSQLLGLMGLQASDLPPQSDRARWDEGKAVLARAFKTKTRAQWVALLEGTDVCFAPVLSLSEAPDHAHMKARGTYIEVGGVVQPAPAPRFSRSTPDVPTAPQAAADTSWEEALAGWLEPGEVKALSERLTGAQ